MKQKWLEQTRPQQVMILIQGFLILLFLVLYAALGRQQAIEYRGEHLRFRTDGDTVTYSGKIDQQKAVFTVHGNTLEYCLGNTLYGPYTVAKDPSAIPSEENMPFHITSPRVLTGIEVYEGSDRLFRGSYLSSGSAFLLYDESGEFFSDFDTTGRVMTEVSPGLYSYGPASDTTLDVHTIVQLIAAPNIVRRGYLGGFALGVLLCIVNAISILYAENLFRWNLRFQIRDPERAEPSDWELFSRWIGWIVLTICALVFFILSLSYTH